jgi:hypothetical protein
MMTPPVDRAAIVGTAPNWTLTPWSDPGLRIVSLNDAYTLNGFQRADEWYELHPLDKFHYRPKHQRAVYAHDVPPGHYVRPEGHLEWLKAQAATIPIWLQSNPPAGWPVNAQRFPKEALEAQYGNYWASGPSYMLLHLLARGVKELHVYGINLATEDEYRAQRPNWEFLLGRFVGREMRIVERDGKRYYEGADSLLVLPQDCPILTHGWQYGYQPKPAPNPIKLELRQLQHEQGKVATAIVQAGRWTNLAPQRDRLRRIEALMQDCQLRLAQQTLPPPIVLTHAVAAFSG